MISAESRIVCCLAAKASKASFCISRVHFYQPELDNVPEELNLVYIEGGLMTQKGEREREQNVCFYAEKLLQELMN